MVARRRRIVAPIVVVVLLFSAARPNLSAAAESTSSEYDVKAALLLNFAQFIEWPASAFANRDAPFVVGILGDDPFGQALERTFANQTVQDRRIVIKRSAVVEDLRGCQLLFVARSERDRVGEILAAMKQTNVATVGEVEDFARRGGVLNFFLEKSKIHFEINVGAAKREDLRISSQLLRRAKIIDAENARRD